MRFAAHAMLFFLLLLKLKQLSNWLTAPERSSQGQAGSLLLLCRLHGCWHWINVLSCSGRITVIYLHTDKTHSWSESHRSVQNLNKLHRPSRQMLSVGNSVKTHHNGSFTHLESTQVMLKCCVNIYYSTCCITVLVKSLAYLPGWLISHYISQIIHQ